MKRIVAEKASWRAGAEDAQLVSHPQGDAKVSDRSQKKEKKKGRELKFKFQKKKKIYIYTLYIEFLRFGCWERTTSSLYTAENHRGDGPGR